MRRLPKILLLLILVFPASLAAAGKKAPSARAICHAIEQGVPGARFERESHLRLGRLALAFVKPIVRRTLDEDDEARAIVSAIKSVDIATYRVIELPDGFDTAAIRRVERQMSRNGWNRMVRTRDDRENTWVFMRHRNDGRINGIFVVELDDYELSIVAVEGKLDEILAHAIADDPDEFSDLFGS